MLRPIEKLGHSGLDITISGPEGSWGMKYAPGELDGSLANQGLKSRLRSGETSIDLTEVTVCTVIQVHRALTRQAKHFAKEYQVQIAWTWSGEAAGIDWVAAASGTTATEDRNALNKAANKSALTLKWWMRVLNLLGVETTPTKTLKGGFRASIPGIDGDSYGESYGALVVYGDSRAEDERTQAAREWVRTQAHALLGTTPKATDGRPERARDYRADLTIRTCPVCFRDIKASPFTNGRIADHGFNITHGWRADHCPGTGELPWERSCEPAKGEIELLLKMSDNLVAALGRLKGGEVKALNGQEYNYTTRKYDEVVLSPADGFKWERALAAYIRDTELRLGSLWSGHYSSIPWMRQAVRTWTPIADDQIAVGAPFNPLVESDWAGKPSIID